MKRLNKRVILTIAGSLLGVTALVVGLVAAAPVFLGFEAESGTLGASTAQVTDSTASGGKAVQFGTSGSFDPHAILPPNATMPSEATCSARVTAAAEIRPQNATYNATAGHNKNLNTGDSRVNVTGAYTGTTDQILQWVACKWGIDVDIVRAQAAKESWWTQTGKGDWTTDQSVCAPGHTLGSDGMAGQCPESYGIVQVRYPYHGPPAGLNTWPEAETSTAYNADYLYAIWRDCYDGKTTWLNNVERGEDYHAGDAWGCVGLWFAGRWHTTDANNYIAAVQDYKNQKIWTTSGFINFR